MTSPIALQGVKVLDLTRLLPGPHATFVLAGYGADVIKVEDTEAGDYARQSAPLACSGFGAAFTATNAGKRSLSVNLKLPQGRSVLERLVQDADVLVESFRPGVMERLGLGHAHLRAINPRLIYCAISGYGQQTADAALAGHDLNYQGVAGLLSQRAAAHANGLPPVLLGDLVGGSFSAVIAILAALLERQHTGQGRLIDISMAHGAMALMPHVSVAAANGEPGKPFGQTYLTGGNPAYGVYTCADGRQITLGALELKFWKTFCTHAGLLDLADATPTRDEASVNQTRARLQTLFLTKPSDEWVRLGRAWDVCLGPVLTVPQALALAQQQALPVFACYPNPQADQAAVQVVKGMCADLAQPELALKAPPMQGQDSHQVLSEHAFDEAAIAKLIADKVVHQH